MANKKHLDVLAKGVKAWNSWLEAEPKTQPDLREADLEDAHLNGINLVRGDLSGACLRGASFTSAILVDADLRNTDLRRADLRHARLSGADMNGAKLHAADLTGARISGADLSNAVLRNAYFNETNLSETNLSYSDLTKANLINADLSHANLQGSILSGSNLSWAELSWADLSGANLRGADLRHAVLINTNLADANLSDAEFSDATVLGTTFGNNDLRTAKGLATIRHAGPSTIGIDTLFRSDGEIPEAFLRGAGIPEDFITFIPSLVERAIEFYSSFISYSHQDEAFSRCLHARMRAEKLRVWFAPEDMKAGRKLHEEIFRAIQIHDKLLLVLSESSMRSEWVMTEIRRAKKVEREENRRKLFPIRLVDFETIQQWECFDADSGKDLAIEVREYYIPDFSNWKNHDSFESEFAKLLRDLKATDT